MCCVWSCIFPFHPYMAFGTPTQVARLLWQSPFAYLVTLVALLYFFEIVSLGSTGWPLTQDTPALPHSPGMTGMSPSLTGKFYS